MHAGIEGSYDESKGSGRDSEPIEMLSELAAMSQYNCDLRACHLGLKMIYKQWRRF